MLDEDLEIEVSNTLAASTQEKTMHTYTSGMRQMEAFINAEVEPHAASRIIFKSYKDNGGVLLPTDTIEPLSCREILLFLAHKRRVNPNLKKNTLASFKSAALKYRVLNGFDTFSEADENEFTRFFRGVRNQLSTRVREGQASPEEGKRHLKFGEYIEICRKSLMEDMESKFETELHLAITIGWNLCARSDTVSNIHARHLDWENDCLKIGCFVL
jgi:hypothetical protein